MSNYQAIEPSSTEAYLCHLSKTIIKLLNNREYDSPFFFSHVRQNVYTDLHGKQTVGLAPFVENHRIDSQGSPTFYVDAELNVTALADDEAGSATVILSQHLSGYGGSLRGMERAGTILFSWQRSKGRWWCSNATMIYGTPEFLV
jgi:hypothetical protein